MNVIKDKIKSPLLESEKTVFSFGASFDDKANNVNESIASKLKENIGKASEKMHAKLHETKEKVAKILSSQSNDDLEEDASVIDETLNRYSNDVTSDTPTKQINVEAETEEKGLRFK
jgi:uncharacterized protein YpuA (DUF1002 family)